MEEYNSVENFDNKKGSVVTIGTFDGVHIGHRAILERLVESANNRDQEAVLLTFFPHPRMVLQKDSGLKLLNTLQEKRRLLESIGVDHMIVQPFTVEFSRLTAQDYVQDILIDQLNAKKIIIGYDHRFGRNRTANIEDLREFGASLDFEVEEIDAQELNEVAVSSTKIRHALEAGDVTTANNYLGYRYMLNGKVVRGKGLGKTLDYPTANLQVGESYKLIPKKGVYITQAKIRDKSCYGLTSIGTNPTVGGTSETIETYFLDLQADLYDEALTLEFITHIREEEDFETVQELKSAIRKDEAFARTFLAGYE